MNHQTPATAHRSHLLLLVLIVAFAAALRFFSLSSLGYWTDEFCTLSCAHGWGLQFDSVSANRIDPPRPVMTHLSAARPMADIIPAMVQDEAHPPLYFLLVRLWEQLLGDSESAVRSLDVIFSLAAIVLLYFTAKDSIGSTAALWACLLMAVAEPQIQFSQEARNYMPVVAFSLAAALAIQQLKHLASSISARDLSWGQDSLPQRLRDAEKIESEICLLRVSASLRFKCSWLRRNCAGFPSAAVLSASLLAMMLTHYFAAGVAAGLAIFAIASLRGRARWLAISSCIAAAVVFTLLWGSSLLRQLPHFRSNYAWVADTSPDRFRHVAINLARLPWRLIAELPIASPLQIAVIVLGVGFLAWLPVAFLRRPELRLWILWFATSVGLVVSVDIFRSTAQLAMLRYTLFATPAMYVLIAGCVRRGRAAFALPAVAVVLGLLSLPAGYVPQWKIDYRTPAQLIGRRLNPGDGLVIVGSNTINNDIMFGAFKHYLPSMPDTSVVLTAPPDAITLARLRQCPHVWVIRVWPKSGVELPNFMIDDQQSIPYFADLIVGRFQ